MKNPFDHGYLDKHDLEKAGFKALGENVQIARNCTIVGLENISIDSNVRIDDYCTIVAVGDGFLQLGSFIHIGAHCHLSAGSGIVMEDFSGLSQRVSIYSRTADYSGEHLTNPMVPEKYSKEFAGTVTLGRHAVIGAGTVILPKLTIGEGCAVGALSLVNKDLAPWGIYIGSPAKRLNERSKRILELEIAFRKDLAR